MARPLLDRADHGARYGPPGLLVRGVVCPAAWKKLSGAARMVSENANYPTRKIGVDTGGAEWYTFYMLPHDITTRLYATPLEGAPGALLIFIFTDNKTLRDAIVQRLRRRGPRGSAVYCVCTTNCFSLDGVWVQNGKALTRKIFSLALPRNGRYNLSVRMRASAGVNRTGARFPRNIDTPPAISCGKKFSRLRTKKFTIKQQHMMDAKMVMLSAQRRTNGVRIKGLK